MRHQLFATTPVPTPRDLYQAVRGVNQRVRVDAAMFALTVRSERRGWELRSALEHISHLNADLQADIISKVLDAEVEHFDGDDRARAVYAEEARNLVVAPLREYRLGDVADALAEI